MRETPKAAEAFRQYCFLGPGRSLAKLAKVSEKFGMPTVSIRHLENWSSRYEWVRRSAHYDKERAEEQRLEQEDALRKMNERHAMIGTTQQAKAIKQIEELIAAKKFGSQASVQLLKLATDLERLARGAATERSELTGKDGTPLAGPAAHVTIWIPDNGRDTKQEGGDA